MQSHVQLLTSSIHGIYTEAGKSKQGKGQNCSEYTPYFTQHNCKGVLSGHKCFRSPQYVRHILYSKWMGGQVQTRMRWQLQKWILQVQVQEMCVSVTYAVLVQHPLPCVLQPVNRIVNTLCTCTKSVIFLIFKPTDGHKLTYRHTVWKQS